MGPSSQRPLAERTRRWIRYNGSSALSWVPEPHLGLSYGQVSQHLNNSGMNMGMNQVKWRELEGCRQAKEKIRSPSGSKAAWLLSRSSHVVRDMVGVLTGHYSLWHLLSIESSSICEDFLAVEQSTYHFLSQVLLLHEANSNVSGQVCSFIRDMFDSGRG